MTAIRDTNLFAGLYYGSMNASRWVTGASGRTVGLVGGNRIVSVIKSNITLPVSAFRKDVQPLSTHSFISVIEQICKGAHSQAIFSGPFSFQTWHFVIKTPRIYDQPAIPV